MNYTVFVLGVWALIQVAIALWGLAIIDNTCENKKLFTNLRILLNVTAVSAVIFMSNMACNYTCYKDNTETPLFIALLTLTSSIITIVMQLYILQNIDECTTKSTDYYKMVLVSAGLITTIFPVFYSLYVIVSWMRGVTKKRGGVEKKGNDAKKKGNDDDDGGWGDFFASQNK